MRNNILFLRLLDKQKRIGNWLLEMMSFIYLLDLHFFSQIISI